MSDGQAKLKTQISTAGDLHSVVRTMKALAAASIGQYERSVLALADYSRTVHLGLGACLREMGELKMLAAPGGVVGAIVFGSDQGLVGQFNEVVAECAVKQLAGVGGVVKVWVVGERVRERLTGTHFQLVGQFPVPNSVDAIVPLVQSLQIEIEAAGLASLYVFHNAPKSGSLYEPVGLRLLPLDPKWRSEKEATAWPSHLKPEVMGVALPGLIREYLFISLFRAGAESLASENSSRLAAMDRADKSIKEMLGKLHTKFQRLRQNAIDEELFDVVSGFEALGR